MLYLLSDMGNDVESPWKEGVDISIENMGDADFERRTDYISLQDSTGEVPAMAHALEDEWGISKNKAADRVVRMYLAKLIDENNLHDLREKYDVTTLIPPQGWTEQIEPLNLDYQIRANSNLNISVPPTVRDMVDELVDDDNIDVSSPADFLRRSITWLVQGEQ